MAEFKHENAALERERWLASLGERGVEISPDESELLEAKGPLGNLLAQALEMHAQYNDHAGKRGSEIEAENLRLTEESEQALNAYQSVLEDALAHPLEVARGEIKIENATGPASSIAQLDAQKNALGQEATGIVVNSQDVFPTLRKLIVQIAKNDPQFAGEKADHSEAQQNMNGFDSLLDTANRLIPAVIAQEAQELTITAKPDQGLKNTGEVKKDPVKKRDNLFKSWEEVFGENYGTYKQDHNFLQLYKNALKSVVKQYPEMFTDCGDLKVRGDFDWLHAIEPVLEMTVAELNSAVDAGDPKTLNTTSRILALAKRFTDDEGRFTPHTELTGLAAEVRERGLVDDTPLIDLFKTKEEIKKEHVAESVTVFDAGSQTVTERRSGRDEKKRLEREKATASVAAVLTKIHEQQTAEINFGFPDKTMDQPQIAKLIRAEGKLISSEFIRRMTFDLGLITPHGEFSSSNHPRYTECDIVQLIMLRATNPKGRSKKLEKYLETVEEVYPDARKRFERSEMEKKKSK